MTCNLFPTVYESSLTELVVIALIIVGVVQVCPHSLGLIYAMLVDK